jgi:hypothetical protein
MRSVASASVVAGALAAGIVAAQAFEAAGIEGRWKAVRVDGWTIALKELTLDISACGERYCGRVVNANNQCEGTMLRVVPQPDRAFAKGVLFEGEIDLPGQPSPFRARVAFRPAPDAQGPRMTITGDEPNSSFVRRTFPFQASFSRIGPAGCTPPKTS